MKITVSQLRRIIKEEVNRVMFETAVLEEDREWDKKFGDALMKQNLKQQDKRFKAWLDSGKFDEYVQKEPKNFAAIKDMTSDEVVELEADISNKRVRDAFESPAHTAAHSMFIRFGKEEMKSGR